MHVEVRPCTPQEFRDPITVFSPFYSAKSRGLSRREVLPKVKRQRRHPKSFVAYDTARSRSYLNTTNLVLKINRITMSALSTCDQQGMPRDLFTNLCNITRAPPRNKSSHCCKHKRHVRPHITKAKKTTIRLS